MQSAGCPTNGEFGGNAAVCPWAPGALLYGEWSGLSDLPIDFGLTCTASDDRACHILNYLPLLNEVLYCFDYELRESSGAIGQLSLVDTEALPISRSREQSNVKWQNVNPLINKILSTHRCIGTLDLKFLYHERSPYLKFFFKERSLQLSERIICDALRTNTSIKSLKIYFSDGVELKTLCATLSSCVRLERLELDHGTRPPAGLYSALATLLRTTTALTVLKIPLMQTSEQEADRFLTALIGNATVSELSLFEFSRTKMSVLNRPLIVPYLKSTTTLQTLRVETSPWHPEYSDSRWLLILEGISENRSLTKVVLEKVDADERCCQKIAKIFAQNKLLRSVTVILRRRPFHFRLSPINNGNELHAFRQNENLEDVTLSSELLSLKQWGQLFDVAARNQTFRRVTVNIKFQNWDLLPQLRNLLRESGAERKVVLDPGCYLVGYERDPLERLEFSRVSADRDQYTNRELSQVLKEATLMDHITILSLSLRSADLSESLASAIRDYFKKTCALKELALSMAHDPAVNSASQCFWSTIVSSLFENKTIETLHVSTKCIDDEDIKLLADAVKQSRRIRAAEFEGETPQKSSIFFRRLSADIVSNYTLLRIKYFFPTERDLPEFKDWYAVWKIARRNSDLIRRAAAFVSSGGADRYGAVALERVAHHRALPEEIAQLCSISEAEAAAMVRKRLQSLHLQSMDGFMRISGVVRERVVCLPRHDGQLQLDDLNGSSWAALRRFLTLEDVRICTASCCKTLKCLCSARGTL